MISIIFRRALHLTRLGTAQMTTPKTLFSPSATILAKVPYAIRPYSSASILSNAEYNRLSNTTLDVLFEDLEKLETQCKLPPGFDVEFSVKLCAPLGGHGTYVINRQPPNRQIWLSSPVSGPKRFDYDQSIKQWIYNRDGIILQDLLRGELARILRADVLIR